MSVYIYTPIEKFIFCALRLRPLPSVPPSVCGLEARTIKLTPTALETDSVLFLLFSLTFIATVLYLPQHLQFVISRAWFYMHGDSHESAGGLAKGVLNSVVGTAAAATAETVREL